MNASSSTVELVRAETADGLFLEGAFQRPQPAGTLPVDVFLLIHGTGSNFYGPGVLETFARQAVADGAAVLRVNTRGHDGICSIPSRNGTTPGGATFEKISDSPFDVTAWANWLESRGLCRVVLVGHSMGGVKAIYSQVHARHTAVCGIIGISPPRFAHERLAALARGAKFREEFARASDLVARGEGNQLIPVTQPLRSVATATGYIEKYGPENRYDYIPLLASLPCPALILIGSESIRTSAAFDGILEAIASAVVGQTQIACEVVAGANINYAGCDSIPFVRAAAWLRAI